MKKILITDSLFIGAEHEATLKASGFLIERIDKPKPTEAELVKAIPGKAGYILGGIEHVTEKIIDVADALEVIAFPGIGYKDFIPAWEYATKKGIAITNAPDGPTHAVAEWAITMALAMNRGVFTAGRVGEKVFETTKGLENQAIGIVGFGRIGSHIAEMLQVFRPKVIRYFSQHKHDERAGHIGAEYTSLPELLQTSDIIFLCVSKDAGDGFFGKQELALMPEGALLVSFMHHGVIDADALYAEVQSGRLRAASDYPVGDRFRALPLSHWYNFNGSNAFNTETEIAMTSSMVVASITNVLTRGEDAKIVNPKFKNFIRTK